MGEIEKSPYLSNGLTNRREPWQVMHFSLLTLPKPKILTF